MVKHTQTVSVWGSTLKGCGITSTAFGTETQIVRHVNFPSSACFNLPGK